MLKINEKRQSLFQTALTTSICSRDVCVDIIVRSGGGVVPVDREAEKAEQMGEHASSWKWFMFIFPKNALAFSFERTRNDFVLGDVWSRHIQNCREISKNFSDSPCVQCNSAWRPRWWALADEPEREWNKNLYFLNFLTGFINYPTFPSSKSADVWLANGSVPMCWNGRFLESFMPISISTTSQKSSYSIAQVSLSSFCALASTVVEIAQNERRSRTSQLTRRSLPAAPHCTACVACSTCKTSVSTDWSWDNERWIDRQLIKKM